MKLSTYLATKAPVTCPHHKHTIGTWLLKLCSKKFYNTRPIFLWQQLIRGYWPSLIFVWVKSSRRRRRNPLGLGLKSVRKFTPTNSHTHPLSPSLTHRHSQFLPLSLNSPSCKEYKIKRSQLLKDNRSTLTLSPNLTYSLLLSLSRTGEWRQDKKEREKKNSEHVLSHCCCCCRYSLPHFRRCGTKNKIKKLEKRESKRKENKLKIDCMHLQKSLSTLN